MEYRSKALAKVPLSGKNMCTFPKAMRREYRLFVGRRGPQDLRRYQHIGALGAPNGRRH